MSPEEISVFLLLVLFNSPKDDEVKGAQRNMVLCWTFMLADFISKLTLVTVVPCLNSGASY